ncbi:MAG TPA: glycoside hydrolase [Elusimicrobia bacterium]|nr:MAG: hypothetical protein A2X37_08855 [Elusimicrobia bacterium GWA2_66_18]HAZ08608.1 glycoside hydrolase [Elusimicrobiota bacterium]
MKRYACIHGHFYQPPRENPWTGEVERQPSAGRDHDWNARVARECYVPNGEARVVDGAGRIVNVVANYEHLSFNFGPTLLSWFEDAHPHAYAQLLEADRRSVERLGGHGNAIAQPFHHAILPLADSRDRETEIRWGLADFRKRFGREAEGMWLPECAVDDATLAALARAGVKFTILEPHQAESVRPLAGGTWRPAKESLRAGAPYLWRGEEGEELALFFYDGPLSRAVAFENAMSDSRLFARRIASHLPPTAEDGLCLLATDGESYGHHARFGEMGLAHLLRYALPHVGVEAVNLGWYLAKHPPRHQVRLKSGGTSWSCAHGVERWRSDCGCGEAEGHHQRWRRPLREALERLRGLLAALYEEQARGLVPDPWAARDAYGAVVLDRGEETIQRFLSAHVPGIKDEASRVRALKLLELQRHSLMMFTSCGWFFDELSRLEPVQVLLYAARALELARDLGTELEKGFVSDLALAPSNDAALQDGAGVWERRVKPQVVTRDHVAAHYAAALLFEDRPAESIHHHRVRCEKFTRRAAAGVTVAAGFAEFTDGVVGERWKRSFFSAVLPGQRVQAFVCGELPAERFEALLGDAASAGQTCALPPGRVFLLRDLRPDERERVLTLVLKRRIARWEAGAHELLEEALPLVEQFRGLGLSLPPGLGEETQVALAHALNDAAGRFAEGIFGAVDEARSVLARAKAAGLEVPVAGAEATWNQGISRVLDGLEKDFTDSSRRDLREAVEVAALAGLGDWRPAAQTRYFRLLQARATAAPAAAELAAALGIALGASPEGVRKPE